MRLKDDALYQHLSLEPLENRVNDVIKKTEVASISYRLTLKCTCFFYFFLLTISGVAPLWLGAAALLLPNPHFSNLKATSISYKWSISSNKPLLISTLGSAIGF